jgi:hypothetical protein
VLALFVQFVIVLHRHHADAVIMYWFPRVWEGQEGVALDDDRVTKVKRAPCNVWRVTHHDYALFQFLDAARKVASSGGDETAAMDEFEAEALSLKVLAPMLLPLLLLPVLVMLLVLRISSLAQASHPELFANVHADDVFHQGPADTSSRSDDDLSDED